MLIQLFGYYLVYSKITVEDAISIKIYRVLYCLEYSFYIIIYISSLLYNTYVYIYIYIYIYLYIYIYIYYIYIYIYILQCDVIPNLYIYIDISKQQDI